MLATTVLSARPRPFVVAQPEIDRMAQLVVGGPLGEPDLRDEVGPHPVRAARWS